MSLLTNICIFCSRDCDRDEICESELQKTRTITLQQFVKLVERYLETSFIPQTANRNFEEGVLETCQDCFSVVESFCSLYHKWKCLEMELEWRLRQLCDAMKGLEGRLFESRLNAQCNNEDREFSEVLKKFRKGFQQKCTHNFSKSFPRVSLNLWKDLPTKQEVCHLNNEAGADFNELFLGWVSTLAVVFQLGLGNSLQQSNEVHDRSGGHHHILISECCDDDDEQFEEVQNRENLSSCSGAREIGFFASSDNQFVLQNAADLELESHEFTRPSSQQELRFPLKVLTRKRLGLYKCSFTASDKQRHDLRTNAPFKCSCCSRNFGSVSQLKCHQRAFTHVLMKRKFLYKQANLKRLKRTKRQTKNSNKVKTCTAMTNEHVGVLRPLQKTTNPNSVMDDSDGSLRNDEQKYFGNDDDDWNLSSSEVDNTSSSSGSISSSSSSGSISSDEDEKRPCSSSVKLEVPTKNYTCTIGSCLQSFYFKEELDEHLRLHGSFACSLCDKVEEYTPDLALHESDHIKQVKIEGQVAKRDKKRKKSGKVVRYCARCSFSTEQRYLYINHYLKTHLKVPTQCIKCRVCKVWTKDRKHFSLHMKHAHEAKLDGAVVDDNTGIDSKSVKKCQICPASFLKRRQLQSQKKEIHSAQDLETSDSSSESSDEVQSQPVPAKCTDCGSFFACTSTLEKHKENCKTKEINTKVCKKKFPCEVGSCKHSFDFKQELEIHQKHHGQFSCQFCKVVKTFVHNLVIHERVHARKKSKGDKTHFHCARCNYKVSRLKRGKMTIVNHYLKKHFGLPLQRVKCSICKAKTFKNEEDFENHRKLHGKFTCSFCPVIENYAPNLAIHESTHVQSALAPSAKGDRRGQPYSCSRCTSIIHGKFRFVEHFLETHLNLPSDSVTCQNCGEKCSYNGLRTHLKSHHDVRGIREEEVAKCDKCPAFFIKQIQLVSHQKKRHGEDNLTCVDCGKKYVNPFVLQTHRIVVHKNKEADFPLACDAPSCERRFERKAELEWHKHNIHAGKGKDNSLVCDKCGKKCSTKTALATHVKVHVEDKVTIKKRVEPRRFVCEECGNAFISRQALEIHQMTHTGPSSWIWGCLFCGKKCLTEHGLEGHLRAHVKAKPYICQTCGAEYALGRDLRNHRNKKHNANEQPLSRRAVNARVSKKGQKLPPRLWK